VKTAVPQTASYGPLERHQIDIYPARGRDGGPAPVLVYIYGGGWNSGRRSLYRFLGQSYAAKGYTVAIPDYRIHPGAQFPDFVDDAARALRWVTDNISAYGGDPARLHLMGHSAGAHTGALLCLDESHLEAVDLSPSRIRSFVGIAGPYSFNPLEYEATRPIFEHLDDVDVARPIKHAHGDAPPMLLLHSRPDKTVPLHNSEHLHAAIVEAGGEARQITYPLPGHVGIIVSIAFPARLLAPVFRDSLGFLRAHDAPAATEEAAPSGVFA
jgi:acetyl esterase/lipase